MKRAKKVICFLLTVSLVLAGALPLSLAEEKDHLQVLACDLPNQSTDVGLMPKVTIEFNHRLKDIEEPQSIYRIDENIKFVEKGTDHRTAVALETLSEDEKTVDITPRQYLKNNTTYQIVIEENLTSSDSNIGAMGQDVTVTEFTTTSELLDEGSQESPILISNAKEFYEIGADAQLWGAKHYKLTADIDLTDLWEDDSLPEGTVVKDKTSWNPGRLTIRKGKSSGGSFDGNGKTIQNLIYKTGALPQNFGLFGQIRDAFTIKNVTISGVEVSANTGGITAGILVGQGTNGVVLDNCHVVGTADLPVKMAATRSAGFIVGKSGQEDTGGTGTIIKNCSVENAEMDGLTGQGSAGGLGGIVGMDNENTLIENCSVKNVTIRGTRQTGGILGMTNGPGVLDKVSKSVIKDCLAEKVRMSSGSYSGAKETDIGFVGGVAGIFYGQMEHCVAKDITIQGVSNLGGLIGNSVRPSGLAEKIANCSANNVAIEFKYRDNSNEYVSPDAVNIANVGGLIGKNGGSIENSVVAGAVCEASEKAGCFSGGGIDGSTYTHCYYVEDAFLPEGTAGITQAGIAQQIELSLTSPALTLPVKKSLTVEVAQDPDNDVYQPYQTDWSISSNGKVTPIDHSSAQIDALSAGVMTITAKIDGMEKSIAITAQAVNPPHLGGGGGGGGSSSSSNTSSADKTTTITVAAKVKAEGNKTMAEVTSKEIKAAVEKSVAEAKKNNTDAVVKLDVDAVKSSDTVEVNLPKDALESVNAAEVTAMIIATPLVSIECDQKILKQLVAGMTGDMKITLRKADSGKLGDSAKAIIGNRPILDFGILSGGKTVTEFGGSTLLISIPYPLQTGEEVKNLAAYYVKEDGSLEKMSGSRYDTASKCITFDAAHLSTYAVGAEGQQSSKQFGDVKSGEWFADYVYDLVEKGVLKGRSESVFAPQENITRAEFATILTNLAKANVSALANTPFNDVAADAWYQNAVAWAADTGVADGIQNADGTKSFKPQGNITRQEMAVMIARYADKVAKKPLSGTKKVAAFADDGQIASYAKDAVLKMRQAGILAGRENGMFGPKDHATRAEAAKMISIFIQGTESK